MTAGFFGLFWEGPEPSLHIRVGHPRECERCIHHAVEQNLDLKIFRGEDDCMSWSFGDQRACLEQDVLTVNRPLDDSPLFERAIVPAISLMRDASRVALHASAVGRDGRCVVFLGPSGTGKSTSATELAGRFGFEFLSDDICVLDTSLRMFPGPPWAWLWTDSPEKQRRFFDRSEQTWTLAKLVVLRRGQPGVRQLTSSQAMEDVFGSAFRFSDDPVTTSRFVKNAAEILRRAPIWEFSFQPDPEQSPAHLPALHQFLDDL